MTNKPENISEYDIFESENTDSRKHYLRVNKWITSEDFFITSYFFIPICENEHWITFVIFNLCELKQKICLKIFPNYFY